jgi:hypothetical protein
MDLLLKKDAAGAVLLGTDRDLLVRAATGDDLFLYLESIGFEKYLLFGNCVVSHDRVTSLGLSHLAAGYLTPPTPHKQSQDVIQCIHDSQTNSLCAREPWDAKSSLTSVYRSAPTACTQTWYSTRKYVESREARASLRTCGDQCKLLLTLTPEFRIVMRPDITYFPRTGREYLVKSSTMLLPSAFASDPMNYIRGGKALTDDRCYSSTWLNIGSDDLLTIIHKRRFMTRELVNRPARKSRAAPPCEEQTLVTNIRCEHVILVPTE